MPFAFDITNPVDTFLIPNYPQNERDHRKAVFDSLEIEHDTAEGYHKFGIGDIAARDMVEDEMVIGSVWLLTEGGISAFWSHLVSTGPPVWANTDARSDAPHLDEQSDFTGTQWATYDTITPTGSFPDEVAIDFALSPYKRVEITADSDISNPINLLAASGKGATIVLDLTMDGTGGHAITFSSRYHTGGGATLQIATAADAITTIYIKKMSTTRIL